MMNNSGNNQTNNDDEGFDRLYTICCVCFGIAVLFNIIILIIGKACVDFDQNFQHYFIMNITISDPFYSILLYNTEVEPVVIKFYDRKMCYFYFVIYYCFSMSTVTLNLMLTVYRFTTIYFPFKARVYLTKGKIMLLISFCWASLLITSIIFVCFSETVEYPAYGDSCDLILFTEGVFYTYFFVFTVVPLLISFVLDILIFIIAQKKRNKANNAFLESKNFTRRLFLIFSYIIWIMITYVLPRLALAIILMCHDNDYNALCDEAFINFLFEIIVYLWIWPTIGSSINPVIIFITHKDYRKCVKKFWQKLAEKLPEYRVRVRFHETIKLFPRLGARKTYIIY